MTGTLRTAVTYFVVMAAAVGLVTLLVIDRLAVVAFVGGLLTGLRAGCHWRVALRQERNGALAQVGMWNRASNYTALDEVGPATPKPVQYDKETERQCGNCGKPAVFAWTTDGVPFAACNFCISLWFIDGLPEWVERIGQNSEFPQVNQVEPPDSADFYGIHSELPRPPIAMTGVRDTEAQDRELSEVYGLNDWAQAVHAEDDSADSLPRSIPGRID